MKTQSAKLQVEIFNLLIYNLRMNLTISQFPNFQLKIATQSVVGGKIGN